MLPPRYRVRVKIASGAIESHPCTTKAIALAKFSEMLDVPGSQFVQLDDSGVKRGEFKFVQSCDLTKDYNSHIR